ncbi:TetR/AcrR family transcriptional regulator [Microbacterium sp.]|uniref:TetR/AcrR family transcriptional regulator n=1 Tax=Microbacterium sp. TaxID=51671 RepID=UPI0027365F90|nr:TetR/AcrR family transcriptional regulator [Microbacterium sp.]MDP3950430.1 TetR/AcrR family transcriptional regulator [Microbacterium sp.]
MHQSTPPPSPTSASSEGARTLEIRRTAARLFEESGYSATTMTDIANAVGVLPGSLYHHFKSKEALAVEILGAFNVAVREVVDATDREVSSVPARERVQQLASSLVTVSLAHGAAVQFHLYAAPTVSSSNLSDALKFTDPGIARLWRDAMRDLVPPDDPRQDDLNLLRFAFNKLSFNASSNTSGLGAGSAPERHSASRISHLISDLLFDGLTTDCPSDEELDQSDAMAAARAGTLAWRARPSTSSDAREDILTAARTAFATRGYDATTIRDIADAAGVRMGTLYRRIESKEELLAVILTRYSDGIHSALQSVLTSNSSVPACIDGLAYVTVRAKRQFREESDIVSRGIRAHAFDSAPFQQYAEQTRVRLRMLEKVLARGMSDGSVRPLGAPAEIGTFVRSILWLPFQDHASASAPRAHRFLRRTLLRGFLTD